MNLFDRWNRQLNELRYEGRYRALKLPAGLDFSSNDYLGYSLSSPFAPSEAARSGAASRLLRGHHHVWNQVEDQLATWHRSEAALMLTSGYAANEGLLSTIIEPSDLAFSDRLNHASIIDGLRLSKAEKILYRHNDLNNLDSLMRERHGKRPAQQAWFIITESLFGMEGDVAPLVGLADLAQRYEAHLIVDEAHATGCFGPTGSGLVDALGLRDRVLATVHTGGKALAVMGAYLACSAVLKDVLVNRCRHLIFTTALPPLVGQWWLETLDRVARDEQSRSNLHERSACFRKFLETRKVIAGGSHYIATILLGEDARAVAAANQLQQAGYDIRAIRYPTVPAGTARLRISLHANHEPTVLADLAAHLVGVVAKLP